jgi:hypothetical protein
MTISDRSYARRLLKLQAIDELRLKGKVSGLLKRMVAAYINDGPSGVRALRDDLARMIEVRAIIHGEKVAQFELDLIPRRKQKPVPPQSFKAKFRAWVREKAFDDAGLIIASTIERARAVLDKQVEENKLDPYKLRKALLVSIASSARALAIARTEIASASNYAGEALAKETGLTYTKKWISAEDERTRASHKAANSQKADVFGFFNVGGYQMAHPTDSSQGAPASEIINCRCAVRREYDL